MKKELIKETRQFQKIAGILKETWHPDKEWDEEDDQEDNGQNYPSDEDLFGLGEDADVNEMAGGFKFKVGDVVNSKVSKGNKLVVLMAFPNLEAAYEDRGESKPDTWESSIVNGEVGPVSDDIANKPWYLTWTREVEGENLLTCDPEEFLSK